MLQALLNGKLSREQENMEDILTSNVFGLLKYVPAREGLLKYLALAEDTNGDQPLKCLSSLSDVTEKSIDYDFWPGWKETDCDACEPDVVITLRLPNENDLLVLVEAKYLCGKSSEADEAYDTPTDQLAKEWDNLRSRAKAQGKAPSLIYLTAHYAYPHQDIKDAINEFKCKRPGASEPVIYWLSWRHLYKVCEDTNNTILNDLAFLLGRLNLKFFYGVKLDNVHIPWSFQTVFDWQKYAEIMTINWRFEK